MIKESFAKYHSLVPYSLLCFRFWHNSQCWLGGNINFITACKKLTTLFRWKNRWFHLTFFWEKKWKSKNEWESEIFARLKQKSFFSFTINLTSKVRGVCASPNLIIPYTKWHLFFWLLSVSNSLHWMTIHVRSKSGKLRVTNLSFLHSWWALAVPPPPAPPQSKWWWFFEWHDVSISLTWRVMTT